MNQKQLFVRLNWFYILELNQVNLYIAQSRAFKDKYESIVFERTSWVEQQHVDNIRDTIKKLGGRPTKLGRLVSPVIGRIAGKIIALFGVEATLKTDIMFENKAMKDYTELINTIGDEFGAELKKILEHNLVDEDIHTAWFSERLSDYDNIDLEKL